MGDQTAAAVEEIMAVQDAQEAALKADSRADRMRDLEVVLAQCAKRLAARLKTQADVQALARADALLGVRR